MARRLLALEARKADGADSCALVRRVHEKLFGRLASLVGASGARALWARSVKLTVAEFPVLREIDFEAKPTDSPADLLVACLRANGADAITDAAVAVCATLLALLATLIGERLTLQVLHTTWPDFDATNQEKG